ncbi:hypothetical protein, partial [Actinotalea sp. JY-7885]
PVGSSLGPPWPRDGGVRLGPGVTLGQMLVTGHVDAGVPQRPLGRGWASVPRVLAHAQDEGPVVGAARVLVGVLVLWTGTFAGFGRLPAERVAWPWEPGPVTATVVDVTADLRGRDALLGRLGLDVASTYEATVRTADGDEVRLPAGTHPLAVGDTVRVVVQEPVARSLTRSSTADVLVMGTLFALAALGLQRVVGGLSTIDDGRRVRQLDWDQRVATGRPRRRRRPRTFLGPREERS